MNASTTTGKKKKKCSRLKEVYDKNGLKLNGRNPLVLNKGRELKT